MPNICREDMGMLNSVGGEVTEDWYSSPGFVALQTLICHKTRDI